MLSKEDSVYSLGYLLYLYLENQKEVCFKKLRPKFFIAKLKKMQMTVKLLLKKRKKKKIKEILYQSL